jgi:hypothetical protein
MTNKIFYTPLSTREYVIFSFIPILTLLLGFIDSLIIVPWYDSYQKKIEIIVALLIIFFNSYTLIRFIGRVVSSDYNVISKILDTALCLIISLFFFSISVALLLYTDLFYSGHRVIELSNSVFYNQDCSDGQPCCKYFYRYKKSIFLKRAYVENTSIDYQTCSCKQIDEQNIQLGEKGYLNLNTLKVKEIE